MNYKFSPPHKKSDSFRLPQSSWALSIDTYFIRERASGFGSPGPGQECGARSNKFRSWSKEKLATGRQLGRINLVSVAFWSFITECFSAIKMLNVECLARIRWMAAPTKWSCTDSNQYSASAPSRGKLSLAPDAFIRALENSVTCCSIYCKVHGFQVVANVVPFVMTSDTPSDPGAEAHAPPYHHNDLWWTQYILSHPEELWVSSEASLGIINKRWVWVAMFTFW